MTGYIDWIPCDLELPTGSDEVMCLVTCRQWNIFMNEWGDKEVKIMAYSVTSNCWNTKGNIEVEAWIPLPKPYEK